MRNAAGIYDRQRLLSVHHVEAVGVGILLLEHALAIGVIVDHMGLPPLMDKQADKLQVMGYRYPTTRFGSNFKNNPI